MTHYQRLIFIFGMLLLISCKNSKKSNEFLRKAQDVYYSSGLNDQVKIDSSFKLTCKAIELDDENFQAYTHKGLLQLGNRDAQGLLETIDAQINLRPQMPVYLAQKALLLEITGDSLSAQKYQKEARQKYENLLEEDSLNFDYRFEYMSMLEVFSDTSQANLNRVKLKEIANEDQLDILENYPSQLDFLDKFRKYWRGKIESDEMGI